MNRRRLVRQGGKLARIVSAVRRSDFSYAESRIGPLFHQIRFDAATHMNPDSKVFVENLSSILFHIAYYVNLTLSESTHVRFSSYYCDLYLK